MFPVPPLYPPALSGIWQQGIVVTVPRRVVLTCGVTGAGERQPPPAAGKKLRAGR